MNTELLRRVQAHILKNPDGLRMQMWLRTESCKTVGCIAGWCVHLDDPSILHEAGLDIPQRAQKLLQITASEAERLFYFMRWPDKFYSQFINASTFEMQAQSVADRIDNFIETDGAV